MKRIRRELLLKYVWAAIIVAISLVFILEFGGPQSEGCTSGLKKPRYAAKVNGTIIPEGDFRAAYQILGFGERESDPMQSMQSKQLTLDALIESELLAQEAERVGFDMEHEEVMLQLAREGMLYLGSSVNAPGYLKAPPRLQAPVRDEAGNFDKEGTRRFIQNYLRRSISEFAAWQRREILAYRMRELIAGSSAVSDTDVVQAYQVENDKASLRYVKLSPFQFSQELAFDPNELTSWINKNSSRVYKEYQAQKKRFAKLPKQVRARHILVKVAATATPGEKVIARRKAQALFARVRQGEDFSALARQYSEDPGSAIKGGDLGFNPRGRMVEAFDKVQFTLKPGELAQDLVESPYGFHIIHVDAVRQGNIPFEQAKLELAEELYRKEKTTEFLKRIAYNILTLRKSGLPLEQALAQSLKLDDESVSTASKPHVQETAMFTRREDPIAGLSSPKIRQVAFELSSSQPLVPSPLHIGEDWVVFELKERTLPQMDQLNDAERSKLRERVLEAKRDERIKHYVSELRERAMAKDALVIGSRVFANPSS